MASKPLLNRSFFGSFGITFSSEACVDCADFHAFPKLICSLSIGVDMLRAKTLNRKVVILTIAGTLVFGLGLSGLFPMIVVKVGSVLFGSGLIGLGIASIRSQSESS